MNDFNTVHVINGVQFVFGLGTFILGVYFAGCSSTSKLVSALLVTDMDMNHKLMYLVNTIMASFFIVGGIVSFMVFFCGFFAIKKRIPTPFNIFVAFICTFILLNISGLSAEWTKLDRLYKMNGNKNLTRLWLISVFIHCIAMSIAVVLLVATLYLIKNNERLKSNYGWRGILKRTKSNKSTKTIIIVPLVEERERSPRVDLNKIEGD
ncbi:hypothetical protein SNEBB_008418 [Seison nebaliae]|nr:hypothetical protein SNEBB_008418 [Seison nebaliae]